MADRNKPASKHQSRPGVGHTKPAAQAQPATPFSARDRLKALGPGLITGASDDDPSGIGTYSQTGAQLGYGIGWTMLLRAGDGRGTFHPEILGWAERSDTHHVCANAG